MSICQGIENTESEEIANETGCDFSAGDGSATARILEAGLKEIQKNPPRLPGRVSLTCQSVKTDIR